MTGPLTLITPNRLDVIIKYEYAWARTNKIAPDGSWFQEFYKEHIRSVNDFQESNNGKNNATDFLNTFDFLIFAFQHNLWDNSNDLIECSSDGSIRNGAHRLALCMLFDNEFCNLVNTNKKPFNFSAAFFEKRYFPKNFLLYAVEKYVVASPKSHLAVLFPSKHYDLNLLINRVASEFEVIYVRDLSLNPNGVHNLVLHMYRDQDWLSLQQNQGFSKTLRHAQQRFVRGHNVKIVLLNDPELSALHRFKRKLREELGQGNFPIHVPDSKQEVDELVGLSLRDCGIDFLNRAKPKNNERVHELMKRFLEWIRSEGYDEREFCIVGSAYISLEGHREVNDLDVVDFRFRHCPVEGVNIVPRDSTFFEFIDLSEVFCPLNTFGYNGLLVLSRCKIIEFKTKRHSIKDIYDLELLKSADEKRRISGTVHKIQGRILEFSFRFLTRLRSVIPKRVKRAVRQILGKI